MNLMKRASIALVALACIAAFPAQAQLLTKFGPVTGILKGTAGNPQTSAVVQSDVAGLWTDASCTGGALALLQNGHCSAVGGGGTVTSVNGTDASTSALYSFGSAVTTSGNITMTLVSQSAHAALLGPTSGSGQPAFRAIAAADLPAISLTSGVSGILPVANGGNGTASPTLTQGSNVTITGSWPNYTIAASSGCSGANPTGTIGLTAVNGTSSSCVRADGAPALSQAIAPTWTNTHTFSVAPVLNAGASIASATALNWGGTHTAITMTSGGVANIDSDAGLNMRVGGASSFTAAVQIAAAGNVTVNAPTSGVALTVNGISGQNVINVTSVTGQGANVSFFDNGGTQNWDVGGAAAATHMQFYDVTNGVTAMDMSPGGGVIFASNSGGTFSVTIGGTNRLLIGAGVALPNLTSSTSAQTGTVCWVTGTGALSEDPTNTCLTSSIRYKQNVVDLGEGLDAVMKLRPVAYEYKPGVLKTDIGRQVGFIAEEVHAIDPRLTPLDATGQPRGVEYAQMTALLARAIQDQQHEIEQLKRDTKRHRIH
jgi:hypothetical protein